MNDPTHNDSSISPLAEILARSGVAKRVAPHPTSDEAQTIAQASTSVDEEDAARNRFAATDGERGSRTTSTSAPSPTPDVQRVERLLQRAEETGFVISETNGCLACGQRTAGWLMLDLADNTFVNPGPGWSLDHIERHIDETAG